MEKVLRAIFAFARAMRRVAAPARKTIPTPGFTRRFPCG
jgi:hypothetical protein